VDVGRCAAQLLCNSVLASRAREYRPEPWVGWLLSRLQP
jgi:hypothetical protein